MYIAGHTNLFYFEPQRCHHNEVKQTTYSRALSFCDNHLLLYQWTHSKKCSLFPLTALLSVTQEARSHLLSYTHTHTYMYTYTQILSGRVKASNKIIFLHRELASPSSGLLCSPSFSLHKQTSYTQTSKHHLPSNTHTPPHIYIYTYTLVPKQFTTSIRINQQQPLHVNKPHFPPSHQRLLSIILQGVKSCTQTHTRVPHQCS